MRSKCTFWLLLQLVKQCNYNENKSMLEVLVEHQATKMEEFTLKIMIWSGVAVAALLVVFVYCCKSIFLQSKLEFNAESLIN